MKPVVAWPTQPLAPIDAWRKLAIAVIIQAVSDATLELELEPHHAPSSRAASAHVEKLHARAHARSFLTTFSEGLDAWCVLAGVNTWKLINRARRVAADWEGLGKELRLHRSSTSPEIDAEEIPDFDLLMFQEAS